MLEDNLLEVFERRMSGEQEWEGGLEKLSADFEQTVRVLDDDGVETGRAELAR